MGSQSESLTSLLAAWQATHALIPLGSSHVISQSGSYWIISSTGHMTDIVPQSWGKPWDTPKSSSSLNGLHLGSRSEIASPHVPCDAGHRHVAMATLPMLPSAPVSPVYLNWSQVCDLCALELPVHYDVLPWSDQRDQLLSLVDRGTPKRHRRSLLLMAKELVNCSSVDRCSQLWSFMAMFHVTSHPRSSKVHRELRDLAKNATVLGVSCEKSADDENWEVQWSTQSWFPWGIYLGPRQKPEAVANKVLNSLLNVLFWTDLQLGGVQPRKTYI